MDCLAVASYSQKECLRPGYIFISLFGPSPGLTCKNLVPSFTGKSTSGRFHWKGGSLDNEGDLPGCEISSWHEYCTQVVVNIIRIEKRNTKSAKSFQPQRPEAGKPVVCLTRTWSSAETWRLWFCQANGTSGANLNQLHSYRTNTDGGWYDNMQLDSVGLQSAKYTPYYAAPEVLGPAGRRYISLSSV